MTRTVDWFAKGYAVMSALREEQPMTDQMGSGSYPPLNEITAQKQWLGGFGAAWAELPGIDETASLMAFLADALEGQDVLLQQLLSHSKSSQTRH